MLFVARRQAGMGEMYMGEGLVALGPPLAGSPKLGDNEILHRPLIGRREKRHDARLVV
ncbi:MAG: hypothetical protein ACREDM_07385 [Methylocella sp.]